MCPEDPFSGLLQGVLSPWWAGAPAPTIAAWILNPNPRFSMKSMRIPLITLALAGAVTAAWGAESVMNLISSGEAVQKEVLDNKAKMDAAQQKNKDLAGQGK